MSARDVLNELIDYYYRQRDIDKILTCLSDNIEWIGTQEEERASGKEELKKVLQVSIDNVPEAIDVEFSFFNEHCLSNDISIFTIEGHYSKNKWLLYEYDIRGTICVVKENSNWLISNVHVSTPNIGKIRSQLENRLNDTLKKEEILRNSIPGGTAIYHLKKDGRVETEYVSKTLAKIAGYNNQEELLDLIHDNVKNGIPLEDYNRVIKEIQEAVKTNRSISVTYHAIAKNGSYIAINMKANIIKDVELNDDVAILYAVHTLVSDNEKRERRHYQTVMNLLGIAYWEWSKENGFYASKMFSQYTLSLRPIEALKNNQIFDDAIYPDDVVKLKKFFSRGDRKEKYASTIIRLKLINNTYQWTEIFGFKEYDKNGETLRLSCVMKSADQQWVDQKMQLQEALKEAKDSSKAKSEFLTRISHDMRTPLNGIKNFTKFALDTNSLEEIKDYCSKILISEKYLETLINDTLKMSKIEAGKIELKLEPYIYSEFEPSIRNVTELKALQKNIELRFIAPDIKEQRYVLLDKTRLQQIFVNIINNAIKFTPRGGLIEVRTEILDQTKSYETIRFTVSDTGIGMHEDFVENKLFKPFAQENIGNDNEETGTGLGLSIVKQLVELMDGTITCHSILKEGTTFIITILAKRALKIADNNLTYNKYNLDDLKDTKILLCEDHPLNREIALKILNKAGCIVEIAEDGKIGLDKYLQSKLHPYDIILMDIRMPNMDGIETTKQIRSSNNKDALTIPIIAMTANAYEEDIKDCKEAGMNDHLAKPINIEELYQSIYNCLKNL